MAHPLEKHVGKLKEEDERARGRETRNERYAKRTPGTNTGADALFFTAGKFASRVAGTVRSEQ